MNRPALPRHALRALAAAAAAICLAPGAASADGRYFHLVAEDLRDDGDRVSINVPFSIVEKTLALVPYDEVRHGGQLRVNGKVMRREELQEFWRAVKEAKEGEAIEIVLDAGGRHGRRWSRYQDGDSDRQVVRLTRAGGALSISSRDDDGERVEIRLPARFVDALLAGGEDSFTLESVVRAFSTLDPGSDSSAEAIRIDSDDARVRIWVDGRIGRGTK